MRELASDPLFLDPTLDWQSVSPRLVTERRLPLLLLPLFAVGAALLAVSVTSTAWELVWWAVAVALMAGAVIGWFVLVPRMASSWRYAERDDDLLVRRGRLIRRLTVVPYGRMQVIEVSANPVSQRLGIARVTLVTASADTDATIPGVPTEIAHALRDRLAAKGEASAAGL
ncbi:MAG TPA: PH domain-containing protein [Nocardioidaceae bacterium]|nr:PH domain-containing protein [Nocardioidaceae bacterium]